MRVRRAEAFLLDLPFRLTFRHALASRKMTSNLVVRLEDESGLAGWGEGLPREYVTGERPGESYRFLTESVLPGLVGLSCSGVEDVPPTAGERFRPAAGSQSAWCAAELAFLDLAGKIFDRPALSWFGGAKRTSFRYGGVVPLLREGLHPFLHRLKEAGLGHVKVKAGREGYLEAVTAAREVLGDDVSLCVDANGSWSLEGAAAAARALAPLGVRWLEQPLPRGREEDLPRLAALTPMPLMADESLTTEEDARALIARGGCSLFNLRLSKLGGLGAARRIAVLAGEAGIGLQVGCQVGESAILSAAGRMLAATLDDPVALEGSYGTLLLAEDLSVDPYSFGPGGKALLQEGAGLAVAIDAERVGRLAVQTQVIE